MKKIILIILLLLFVNLVSSTELYSINFEYNKGALSLINSSIDFGLLPQKEAEPLIGYTAKVFSFKNQQLSQTKFIIENKIIIERINSSKIVNIDFLESSILLPYSNNGQKIIIYDKDNVKKLEIDVSDLAECNENGKCDATEDETNCPIECKDGRPYGIQYPTTQKVEFISPIEVSWILPAALLIILVTLIVIYTIKTKRWKK